LWPGVCKEDLDRVSLSFPFHTLSLPLRPACNLEWCVKKCLVPRTIVVFSRKQPAASVNPIIKSSLRIIFSLFVQVVSTEKRAQHSRIPKRRGFAEESWWVRRRLAESECESYSFLLKRLFSQLFFFSGSGRVVVGRLLLGGAAAERPDSPPPPSGIGFLAPPGGCTGPPP
jgi:hypothetical protein